MNEITPKQALDGIWNFIGPRLTATRQEWADLEAAFAKLSEAIVPPMLVVPPTLEPPTNIVPIKGDAECSTQS